MLERGLLGPDRAGELGTTSHPVTFGPTVGSGLQAWDCSRGALYHPNAVGTRRPLRALSK